MRLKKLKRVTSFEMEALPPYSFELTVHKPLGYQWLTPDEVYSKGTIWTAMELSSGRPVGLRLKTIGTIDNPKINGAIYSDEKLEEKQERALLNDIIRCAELNTNISDFYSMAEYDPILKRVKTDLYGMRCGRHQRLFHDFVRAVTMQWASLERTKQMSRLLFQTYASQVSFDGHIVSVWFTPEQIARVGLQDLRERCKLGFRAKYLKAIADAILSEKFPSSEELGKMSAEQAKRELMRLKGIGEYSAEIVLPHMERFPIDVWSVNIFWNLFFPEKHIPPLKMAIEKVRTQAKERWKKWRGYAFIYVINDLDSLSMKFNVKLK